MARLTGESVAISIRSPWITIVVFALLTVASAVYTARNFAINTDISNLISPDIDWRQREIALEKAFPARVAHHPGGRQCSDPRAGVTRSRPPDGAA